MHKSGLSRGGTLVCVPCASVQMLLVYCLGYCSVSVNREGKPHCFVVASGSETAIQDVLQARCSLGESRENVQVNHYNCLFVEDWWWAAE